MRAQINSESLKPLLHAVMLAKYYTIAGTHSNGRRCTAKHPIHLRLDVRCLPSGLFSHFIVKRCFHTSACFPYFFFFFCFFYLVVADVFRIQNVRRAKNTAAFQVNYDPSMGRATLIYSCFSVNFVLINGIMESHLVAVVHVLR